MNKRKLSISCLILVFAVFFSGCEKEAAIASIAEFKVIEKISDEELEARKKKAQEQADQGKEFGGINESEEEEDREIIVLEEENTDFVPLGGVKKKKKEKEEKVEEESDEEEDGYISAEEAIKRSKKSEEEEEATLEETAPPMETASIKPDEEEEDISEEDVVVSNYIYSEGIHDFVPVSEFTGYLTKNSTLTEKVRNSPNNIPLETGDKIRVYGTSEEGDYYMVSYENHPRLFIKSDRVSKKEIKKEEDVASAEAKPEEKPSQTVAAVPEKKPETPVQPKTTPTPEPKIQEPKKQTPSPAPQPKPVQKVIQPAPKPQEPKKTVVIKNPNPNPQPQKPAQPPAAPPVTLNPPIPFPSNPESISVNLGVNFADENFIANTIAVTRVSSGPGAISNSTGYHEVTVLASNSVVNATGIGQNGYVRITLSNGSTGFVDSRYLKKN